MAEQTNHVVTAVRWITSLSALPSIVLRLET